jgi:WD40 repeat protein
LILGNMKIHFFSLLFSVTLLIVSCSPSETNVVITPIAITHFTPEQTPALSVKELPDSVDEIVILDFALSPDGQELAVYQNIGVFIYNTETLERTTLIDFESDIYYSQLDNHGMYYPPFWAPGAVAFSPDGKELAISDKFQDEYITIWDWRNKTILDYVAMYPNGNFVRGLEYAPEGDALLVRSTYPWARLQCEAGSEDSITLISRIPRKKIFEAKGCNQWSSINYHFTDTNVLYLFHYGEGSYMMKMVDMQQGRVINFIELIPRLDGLIYDVSQSGKTFAVRDDTNFSIGVYPTILTDALTKSEILRLPGEVAFLGDGNRFLVYYDFDNPVRLQDRDTVLCEFDGLEMLYYRISRENNTLAVHTRDMDIQIWDIPTCKLINLIPFN